MKRLLSIVLGMLMGLPAAWAVYVYRQEAATTAYAGYPAGNIAEWAFDTQVSEVTNCMDSTTNSLWLQGGCAWTADQAAAWLPAAAMRFDGLSGFGRTYGLDDTGCDLSNSWCFAAWFLSFNTSGIHPLFSKRSGSVVGSKYLFQNNSSITFNEYNGRNATFISAATSVWQHVCMAYSAESGAETFTMWVDGVNIGTNGMILYAEPAGEPFRIGITSVGTTILQGSLADVRFYTSAVVDAQAANIYDGTTNVTDNLVAWYQFPDDIPPYVPDGSGNWNLLDPATAVNVEPTWIAAAGGISGHDYYDGVSSYCKTTNEKSFCLMGVPDSTVAAWVRSDSTNAAQTVWSQRGYDGNEAVMQWLVLGGLTKTNTIGYYIYNSVTTNLYIESTQNAYATGTWCRLVAEREVTTNGYIYVDGALVGSESLATLAVDNNWPTNFMVGVYGPQATLSSYFLGGIDEVVVNTNTAWTAAQCVSDAANCPGGPHGD